MEENPKPVQVTIDGEIVFINDAGVKLYGAETREQLIGKSVFEFSHPDEIEKIKERKVKLEKGVKPHDLREHKIQGLDGENKYVEISSIPIHYQGQQAIQTVLVDITGRKHKEQEIIESLDEKETLLREIHHRVKNNLAVISGLLELQAMNAEEESTLNTLRDSQLRVQSIAMIHEKLYQSEALSNIGFDHHLRELVETIASTYSSEEMAVDFTFDLESFSLDLDLAIPCSLIVNEVIVNSLKHAFNNASEGKIWVVSMFDDPEITIKIKDNGSGLPENFDPKEQQSLGMTLIQTLADQLEGEIAFSSNDTGTTFELSFQP